MPDMHPWVGLRATAFLRCCMGVPQGLDERPVVNRRAPLVARYWVGTDWQLQINQEHWEHEDGWA
jgi:hypothetical protein